jgi:predicted SprT family Zn-dependent metalloprotease
MSIDDLHDIAEARSAELIDLANASGISQFHIDYPTIRVSNRMKVNAGEYWFDSANNRGVITFSRKLFEENIKDYLESTIPHEVAHHIEFIKTGNPGHGKLFKQIMTEVFNCSQVQSSSCHEYPVEDRTVAYMCPACGMEVRMGPIQHKWIKTGKYRYEHACCGTKIVLKN